MTFKRGDRLCHDATGPATVAVAKLGPNGEIKVRPDRPHPSGKKIVEVMARRCVALEEKGKAK